MNENFLSFAAHEFRSPLTILRGYAETLQEHPHLASQVAGKMVAACDRLERISRALLLLAQPKKDVSCFLSEVLLRCRENLSERHPEALFTIVGNFFALELRIDPDLLEIALMNLLENSVKYSKSPAQITLIVEGNEKAVTIVVADKGIGIAPESLPFIFDRFYSVDSLRSKRLGGIGLGLSLVKAILQEVGGDIQVTSRLDQGSSFTLRLPQAFTRAGRQLV